MMDVLDTISRYSLHIAGAVLLLVIGNAVVSVWTNPLSKMPGPWYTKWTDRVGTYRLLRGEKAPWIEALHREYGPVVRVAPHSVDISDAAAAQRIHRVKDGFLKSAFYSQFIPGVEQVFNTTSNEVHRRQRRVLSGPLSESGLRAVYAQVNGLAGRAVERMREEAGKRDGVADVFKWWLFMATDVIGQLTFSQSFQMLERGEKNQYIYDLEGVAKNAAIRVSFPMLHRISGYLRIPFITAAHASRERTAAYATESLERHRRVVEESESTDEGVRPTLFWKLFKAEEEDTLSFSEVVHNAQAYIVAGSDTTANTLTYLIHSVCAHPLIRTKLVAELQAAFPSPSPDIAPDSLKEGTLPYLNAVVAETLRLYPAAPAELPRAVPPGGAQLAGYFFPGGATVTTQAYSLHRDPVAFPDPEDFRPERWEGEISQAMKDAYMPFGGGSRVCIGINLARMELRLATARFFLAFPRASVSSKEGFGTADMEQNIFFLMSPRGKRCLIDLNI